MITEDESINREDFIFFFKYEGDTYGAGENSRIIFAKLKDSKDEDNTPGFRKQAMFSATNLTKKNNRMFGNKDVDKIEIITDKNKLQQLSK